VSRDDWTVLPIPQAVIEKINKKAESEEIALIMKILIYQLQTMIKQILKIMSTIKKMLQIMMV
jgi:hypothetical protein